MLSSMQGVFAEPLLTNHDANAGAPDQQQRAGQAVVAQYGDDQTHVTAVEHTGEIIKRKPRSTIKAAMTASNTHVVLRRAFALKGMFTTAT
jgi:hypothetical protein